MKVEKVLLINCTLDKHSRAKIHNVVSSPNLGLLSIAGVLIMHGYDVKILDFFADPIKKEQYKKILEEFNPDVIGYSVYTRTVPFLRRKRDVISSNSLMITGCSGPDSCCSLRK